MLPTRGHSERLLGNELSRRQGPSRGYTEPAPSRREMQRNFLAGLDRLVESGDQFQTLASFKTIHQGRALVSEAIDHVLIVGLMAKAVDIRRIDGKFFHHLG